MQQASNRQQKILIFISGTWSTRKYCNLTAQRKREFRKPQECVINPVLFCPNLESCHIMSWPSFQWFGNCCWKDMEEWLHSVLCPYSYELIHRRSNYQIHLRILLSPCPISAGLEKEYHEFGREPKYRTGLFCRHHIYIIP